MIEGSWEISEECWEEIYKRRHPWRYHWKRWYVCFEETKLWLGLLMRR